MTGRFRLYDTGLRDASWNVAAAMALAAMHREGRFEGALRLARYRPCVLLGQSTPAETGTNLEACRRAGASVVRRATGGGSVFIDPGMVTFDIVMARRGAAAPECLAAAICESLAAMLAQFGVEAAFRPPGDITVAGRKLAGTAGWQDGGTLLFQGVLILSTDPDLMVEVLGISARPLPVVSLAACGARPDGETLAAAIRASICGTLGWSACEAGHAAELETTAEAWLDEVETVDLPAAPSAGNGRARTGSRL